MAGIFQPTLQSDVTPVRPVETQSAITSIARLGETIATGLSKAKDRAEVEARRNAPTWSQIKDERDNKNLADYVTRLQEIHDSKDQVSNSAYNLSIRQLNMDFIGRGVDISGSAYTSARETVTGLDDALVGRSDDEILLQDLAKTPDGQSEIALATQDLIAQKIDPTQADVAALVRQRRATKMAVANMQVTDEASFRQAKPIINDLINNFQRDTQNAVTALNEAGVPISASMVQNQYVNFLELQNNIVSKIPANIPEAQKQDVLGSLKRMEDFFVQLGMTQQGGEIKLLNPDELQVQDKTRTFISILSKSDSAADTVLAMKLMDKNYQVDPATYSLIETRIAELGETTDVTPDWITDSDIVVTNDLIGTYNNLVRFEQSGGLAKYNLEEKLLNGAMSLVNPEERDKWAGMTNAQGWTATKAFGSASNGFSKEAILSGQMTDGFYNSIAGLALSFESIDILDEPVSFAGVRKEVSSKLPELIKTAEAVDPAKGAAIKALMFRSLTSQKFQYDTRIASDEAAMGIKFNPTTGAYNVDSTTSNPQQLLLHEIVNSRYGGSLSRLYEDNFRSIQWSDFPEDQARALAQGGMTPQAMAQSIFSDFLPSQDDFKTLLDMRNSSVYLSSLAMQMEPQASKDARAIAQDAMFTIGEADLPSGAEVVKVGEMDLAVNTSMQPLIGSMTGASKLTVEGADQRLNAVLSGPFQTLQDSFGKTLVINDALAKDGTSREADTPNSRHFHGDAIDISLSGLTDEERVKLVDAALNAGFQGFGFGNNILHIDMGERRAWAYGNETFGGVAVNELMGRVHGSSAVRPNLPTPTKTADLQTPEVDPNEGAPTNFTVLRPDITVEALPPAEVAVDQPVDAAPAAPQERPQQQQQQTAQPTISPEVQALLDSLTNATDEEKQRILEFLGGQ